MRRFAIFARHGNTFESGQKVVMVGAREDLSLTEVGCNQARAVGLALQPLRGELCGVRAGPLRRTRDFAGIVNETLALTHEVEIDQRLVELDYGAWSGLSDQEIEALSGSKLPLQAWQEQGKRPEGVVFTPSEDDLRRETVELLDELRLQQGISLVVTSNGRLREVGRIVGQDSARSWKVGTGKLCVLESTAGSWSVVAWDLPPERLCEVLPPLSNE
jgi:2,3-bisphosphoglycerate-dependent phosphoglycerate mutase